MHAALTTDTDTNYIYIYAYKNYTYNFNGQANVGFNVVKLISYIYCLYDDAYTVWRCYVYESIEYVVAAHARLAT